MLQALGMVSDYVTTSLWVMEVLSLCCHFTGALGAC